MLVVDDSRMNLLKMKEKLLKITKGDRQALLNEYKDLVLSIDKDEYNALVSKIKDTNYTDLPLEEQVLFLNDIISNYNSLNEFQYRCRDTYSKYSQDNLELSDISKIFIEEITERCSVIQGYLMNLKNLENNKIELEKLNLEHINAMKKQNLVDKVIKEANSNLRTNILMAEGRIVDDKGMSYTSAIQEYKDIGLDLRLLLNDQDMLDRELARATKEKNDNNETLSAAMICYKDNPQNEDIYNKIKEDVKKSEYAVTLLEIANEIAEDTQDYDLMLNKLYRLANLIEERKLYLREKFYIDPFDRIKVNEQLEMLEDMRDSTKDISNITKTMSYFTRSISEIEEMNKEYYARILEDEKLLSDDLTVKEVIEAEVPEAKEDLLSVLDKFQSDEKYEDNQVKRITDPGVDFNVARAHEKSAGVIKRVSQLFGNIPEKVEEDTKAPELLIEDVSTEEEVSVETLPVEMVFDTPEIDNSVFEDNQNVNTVFEENGIDNAVFEDNQNVNEVFEENGIDNSMFNDSNDVSNVFAEDAPEDNNDNVNPDLFQEIKPFNEVPLFTDRYEDNTPVQAPKIESVIPQIIPIIPTPAPAPVPEVNMPVPQEKVEAPQVPAMEAAISDLTDDQMPDAFWTTREKEDILNDDNTANDNVISFDEQINLLMNNNNDVKVMKKVS